VDQAGPTPGFLRRNIRRHGLALASMVWLATVYLYWREFIPLLPTSVIPLSSKYYEFRGTPNGEIVSMRESDGAVARESSYLGPIQFWNPRDGKLVRQFFGEQDLILALSRHSTLAAVREWDNIRIVDLRKGETVFVRKAKGGFFRVQFSHDGRIVMFMAADKTVVVCDAATGEELWSRRADEWPPLEPGGLFLDLFHCLLRLPHSADGSSLMNSPPPARVWLSAYTGEPEQRFGRQDRVRASVDGKWAITIGWKQPARVCDSRTGQTKWWLPPDADGDACDFSHDSRDVILPVKIDGRIVVARWDASDGRVISPLPDRPFEPVSADLLGDRPYLVHYDDAKQVQAPARLWQIVNDVGISWNGIVLPSRRTLRFVNTESGKPIGRIATGHFVSGLSDDGGFAIHEETRVAYYDLPPKRDLQWLAAWSLGPIAAIWLPQILRRRIRLIRLSRESIPAYNRL
jgi:WD40 repeat protein